MEWELLLPILIFLVLIGVTAKKWVPTTLRFLNTNAKLIQSLSSLIQILIWISAATLAIVGLLTSRNFGASRTKDHISVLKIDWSETQRKPMSDSDRDLASCKFNVLIANSSESPVAITSCEAKVFWKGDVLKFQCEGFGGSDRKQLTPTIGNFNAYLWREGGNLNMKPNQAMYYLLRSPINIDPAIPALNIGASIQFFYDNDVHTLEDIHYTDPNWPSYDPEKVKDFFPLDVQFSFISSKGQQVTTQSATCWYIK